MAFEGGYTSALNSAQNRSDQETLRQMRVQEMTQAAEAFKQQQDDMKEQKLLAPKVLELFAEMQLPQPPQQGPQPPPPGQPSVPMQAPPPMPPPQGLGSAMGPPQQLAPPPGGPPPQPGPAMPQGPGPGAPMPAGGPQGAPMVAPGGMMPPPSGARPGGPPAAPPMPPQGWQPMPKAGGPPGAPPQGQLAQPPAPPAEDAYTGGKGFLPPAMASPEKFIAAMKKANVPPEQRYKMLQMVMPLIDKQNKQLLDEAGLELKIANKMIAAQKEALAEWKAEKDAGRGDRKLDQADKKITQQQPLIDARVGKLTGKFGAGVTEKIDPADRESTAAQVATGQPLTQVVPGYGNKAIAARKQARADAIKLIQEETPGMTPAQAGRELAQRSTDFVAGRGSEVQLTKMLGATEQAVKQLDFNVDKVTEEMKKVPSTDLSPILNAMIRKEEKWTGDPAYSSLYFYMHAAAMESARILSGGQASVAQLHQGAAEEAKQWADIGLTPAMWKSVSKAMHDEGQNRLENYKGAIEGRKIKGRGESPGGAKDLPAKNAKGWDLQTDKHGNKAYVSPDRKQFEEVK